MKLKDKILLADAVERIGEITDTAIPDIVDSLTGIAWDEEDAFGIKDYHSDEDDV